MASGSREDKANAESACYYPCRCNVPLDALLARAAVERCRDTLCKSSRVTLFRQGLTGHRLLSVVGSSKRPTKARHLAGL